MTVINRSTWPAIPYFAAWIWALLTLSIFTPALDGAEMNAVRGTLQILILGALALRFAVARWRRERSRVWLAYVIVMILAAPIWLGVEAIVTR